MLTHMCSQNVYTTTHIHTHTLHTCAISYFPQSATLDSSDIVFIGSKNSVRAYAVITAQGDTQTSTMCVAHQFLGGMHITIDAHIIHQIARGLCMCD